MLKYISTLGLEQRSITMGNMRITIAFQYTDYKSGNKPKLFQNIIRIQK